MVGGARKSCGLCRGTEGHHFGQPFITTKYECKAGLVAISEFLVHPNASNQRWRRAP